MIGLVIQKVKLTKNEISRFKNGENKKDIVYNIAERTYHPCGYGIYGQEKIYEENGEYYAQWLRAASCD